MNKWRIALICLLGVLQLSAFAAPKDNARKEKSKKEEKVKVDEPKRVYLYGVATNFNDSVTYITQVQHLDSVIIHPNGALQNYSIYSMQLKVYLEGTLNEINQTSAVIYSDNKKKLEKRFVKTRKKILSDRRRTLKQVGTNAFVFEKR